MNRRIARRLREIIDAVDEGKYADQEERWENIYPLERDQIVSRILSKFDLVEKR